MRLEWLGGAAAIALLATMGTASAVPCTTGPASCTVTGSLFSGATPPPGFDNLGVGTAAGNQGIAQPLIVGSQTITWAGGTPPSGVYAGTQANLFTSPFTPTSSLQRYLVAGGGGGSVTVTDAVGEGNTLSLIWGTIDADATGTRNLLVSTAAIGAISVNGATALAACAGAIPSVSDCIITVSGLGNWTGFTASNSSAAAFEFVPQTEVPEPASLAILGASLVGFGIFRRRKTT